MNADFTDIAGYYDALYVNPEDYRREAEQVFSCIDRYGRPGGRTLLDLACGTGAEAAALSERFEVTGLDLSAEMLAVARRKAPRAEFLQGDLFQFQLGRRFDAVVNLYGSIGFAHDETQLRDGLRCAYAHLEPGGVFLLTPWDTRETFQEKMVADSGRRDGLCFCRMEAVRLEGPDAVVVEMHHLIGRGGRIEEHRHRQRITLFSEAQYREALGAAGFRLRERLSEKEFRMGAFVCTR